jgi:hypothetical protein
LVSLDSIGLSLTSLRDGRAGRRGYVRIHRARTGGGNPDPGVDDLIGLWQFPLLMTDPPRVTDDEQEVRGMSIELEGDMVSCPFFASGAR